MNTLTPEELDKKIEHYMTEPYEHVFVQDHSLSSDGYYAHVTEFPGCQTQGVSLQDAFDNLRDAMQSWLTVMIEHNKPIPSPLATTQLKLTGKDLNLK